MPDTTARITVKVPENAEVWVEGAKTRATGPVRQFRSPRLETGREYTYDIRARWQEDGRDVTQNRQVDVKAGSRKAVDFTGRSGEKKETGGKKAR